MHADKREQDWCVVATLADVGGEAHPLGRRGYTCPPLANLRGGVERVGVLLGLTAGLGLILITST